MKRNRILMIMALIALYAITVNGQEVKVPLRFDFYYTYEQMNEALRALSRAYPDLATVEVVGKSDEGRDIYALTINNPKTGTPLSKPGVYVDGNIHGNEIQAGEVCLYLANRLLTNYGRIKDITEVVDRNVYYIIPVVNVDGRVHFFEDGNTSSTNRGLRIPVDSDRDGLFDEDGPDDLDGDGSITNMRIRDPFGRYKTDPEDPRLMVPVKPGEQGEWTMLGQEGIDNDGDGRVNEDPPASVDGNRNWGMNWQPPYLTRGAGNYPFEGTGLKAIAHWMMARPNIIMVWAFHNTGGMFLRGPSFQEAGDFPQGDVAVYDFLGDHMEKIVPGYRYMIVWKDLYATNGDFTDFTDNILGAYSFVGELFQSDTETYDGTHKRERGQRQQWGGSPETERQRLLFDDNVNQGELFKEWTPYKHPLYGDIEIGGWTKYSSRLPHPFMLQDMVHRNASAVIFTARQTPRVTMDVFEVTKLSSELWRVRVRLVNSGAIPSVSFLTIRNRISPKDVLRVSGPNATVVGGGVLTNMWMDQVDYKEHKPEVQMCQVPGSGKVEYQFLVSGRGNLKIEYESAKAGNVSQTIALKER